MGLAVLAAAVLAAVEQAVGGNDVVLEMEWVAGMAAISSSWDSNICCHGGVGLQ